MLSGNLMEEFKSIPLQATGSDSLPRGFTLVELLVVIAIIGILVALLLPAVQTAREAARRVQCQNNLNQLGLAVNLYVSAHGDQLPAGNVSVCDDDTRRCARSSWTWSIMPFIELDAMHEQYDDTLPNSYRAPANMQADYAAAE